MHFQTQLADIGVDIALLSAIKVDDIRLIRFGWHPSGWLHRIGTVSSSGQEPGDHQPGVSKVSSPPHC